MRIKACDEKLSRALFPLVGRRISRTLSRSVYFEGRSLFSGESIFVSVHPSEPSTGIRFVCQGATILASLDAVVPSVFPHCTTLGANGVSVMMVEHFLAACQGLGIDNVLVELSHPELPILDGSSAPFVEKFLAVGMVDQEVSTPIYGLREPIAFSWGDQTSITAFPSSELIISYVAYFPKSFPDTAQFFSFPFSSAHFQEEIAPARTFIDYKDLMAFVEQGFLRGASEGMGVAIENGIPRGTVWRFPMEIARHKILDFIGDFLGLLPVSLRAYFLLVKTGHRSYIDFAKMVRKKFEMDAFTHE